MRKNGTAFLKRSGQETVRALDRLEVHDVLNAYGFTHPKSLFARTSEEAVAAAKDIGYPVVMKIVSPQISHKSDIGGVKVNLATTREDGECIF